MLGRVLYAAAFFLLLIYTMDSQPTDKVEGVAIAPARGMLGMSYMLQPSFFF